MENETNKRTKSEKKLKVYEIRSSTEKRTEKVNWLRLFICWSVQVSTLAVLLEDCGLWLMLNLE